MGKIACLTSMFTRKAKVKVITPAECLESNSVWESSRKTLLSKDSDNFSENSQKGSMAREDNTFVVLNLTTDNDKSETSTGIISKKLLSVPSIAEWAKNDVSSWIEQSGPDCAEVLKLSQTELFEFDTKAVNVPNYDEVDSHVKVVASQMVDGEVVAEVAYEGDDDEEFEKAADSCIIQIQSEGSGSGEHSPDEHRSGFSGDNGTATYYEFHSNMAHGSDRAASHYFDEEAVGDYASDPGVYHDDNSSLGRYAEDVEDGQFHTQSQHADHTLKKARSEGGLYDLGLISQHEPSQRTEQDLVPVSEGSPSCLNVSGRDFSIHLQKGVLESTHSEDAKDVRLNLRFLESGPSALKQKPWWKMLLISHRTIHPEGSRLIASSSLSRSERLLISGGNGYSSDVDFYSGTPKLEVDASYSKSDVYHPESVRSGPCAVIGEGGEDDAGSDVPHISTVPDGVAETEEAYFEAPPSVHDDGEKDPKVFVFHRSDMRRVEEWISSIDQYPFLADEEAEVISYSDTEPSAPADSFFRAKASRFDPMQVDGSALLDRRNHQGDHFPEADNEMASFIARSVNPLSTVAHFSGVGLKLVPPLGVHNNLKTLNLSANAIVRILPGCLPKSLHTLDLSKNKIVVIEGLRELTRLRVLNLSHNRILRIEHGLASCTSLRELYLSGNKFSEVDGLHRLLKLSIIDLSYNKLASGKSIGQLAANYKSLQAINLLGNPLHSNLGEEALRKMVSNIAPQVVYLNKQAMKAVSARDASVDSVARAALGSTNHHTHQRGKTSSQSKPLRRNGKSALPASPSPHHRDKRGGEKSGTGGHGSRPGALKNKAPSELPPRHRHSQSRAAHGIARPASTAPPLNVWNINTVEHM